MVSAYRALSAAQAAISRATTLDEALQEGLKIILDSCKAEAGAIWYANRQEEGRLHPYFWVASSDLTSCSHEPGEGAVGRVYKTQTAERYLTFSAANDPATVADFGGIEITSMICVPFSSATEDLGVIQFVNKQAAVPLPTRKRTFAR